MKFSRKNLGRAASALLATAMLTAFTAVPASAANLGSDGTISGSTTSAISEITIPVTLYKPTMGYTPDVDLKVTVADATDAENNSETINVDGGYTVDVHNGIGADSIKVTPAGGSEGDNVVFSSATDGIGGTGSGSNTISKNISLDVSALSGFSTPGVYKYTLHTAVEKGDSADFTEATDLPMYLFVADRGVSDYVVTGVVVKKSDKSGKANEIANYYMVDPTDPGNENNQSVANLTVVNNVTGAMGDHNEDFTYTLDITTNKTYHAVKTTVQRATESLELKAGNNTFTLKNGESIIIYSLEKNTTFNLKENGKTMGYTVSTNPTGYSDDAGYNVNLTNGSATVTFTNNREAITPTGVVVSVAPYALLVLVAAAAGFVFLRKRRED